MALLFLPEFNLQALNTLAIPALARFYVSVSNDDELREALTFAREQALPLMLLGGGSNIVLRADFPGLVLHLRTKGKQLIAEDSESIWLEVAAGENWHALVAYTLEFHYWGLENLALIPGNVGAAPIQNIGAYGVELKDVFAELKAIEIASGVEVVFTPESCAFSYRDSVFKQQLKDQYVITSVTFKLHKTPKLTLTYPALTDALQHVNPEDIMPLLVSEAVCAIRRSKLPNPEQLPNVGSFFKNPIISRAQFERLKALWPDMIAYPSADNTVKVAAGWLVERAGLRGYSTGSVAVHEHQALVLTNPGRVGGQEIMALAEKIITKIEQLFGITLEQEPRIYP